jgi:subtilisin family serine protease
MEQKSKGLNIRVANMAFGGWTPPVSDVATDPLAIACKSLSDAGILLVAAAGNEGQNIASAGGGYKGNTIYPAAFAFPEMVTVAAITQNGALAKSSNFGSSVDIAAPGYEVKSTALGGTYGSLNGTSVASAHVAGAAALLAAASPELTAGQIKTRLLEYAAGHQTLSGKVASGGSLNIGAAIKNERGSLKVLIEGPASARWSLNGNGSYPSGQVLTDLPAGKHTVSFSDANLWKKPANIAVTITSDPQAEATGKYRQQNASIWVTIEGPEEARWSLNKKGEYTSDQTLGKAAGKRTVSFSEVPGWDAPAPQSVTVPRNAPLAVSGVYTRQTGSVTVTFEGPAEARWSLDGQGSYTSGETVENVPVGNRTVSFSKVTNWDTPQNAVVLVAKGASVAAEGKYIHQVGSIKVTLEGPKEASWNVNGRGLFASGETASNIPVGEHTIAFSAVQDWDHPSAVPVTVVRDETVEISRVYSKHLGSLSVTIKGPSDARCSLDGIDGMFESGAVRADLPVGEYAVVFKDVANWYAPEKMNVTVVKDEVAQREASYAEHRGSVIVEIDGPSEARWSLDGEGSYASGESAKDVVVGKRTVSFSAIDDWDKPADGTVEVTKDAEAAFKGAYTQHKGSLQVVMTDGPAGARWSLNGKGSYKDGETVKDLVVGEYSVSFFDLADWDEPAEQTVKVSKNAVAKLEVELVQHKGSVQVVLFGPEEARWSVDGKGSYASGETVKDLIVGTYRLSFSQVDGWDAPREMRITVAKDTLAKTEPGYTRHLGSVTVTIDGPAEARWSLDGQGSYENGQSVEKVVVGEHTVSFSDIVDWDTPADQTVSVTKDAVSTIAGSYKQHKGSVKITIKGPEEARWSLNGEGSYASDAVVEDLVVGEYAVTFSKIAGWDRPREQKLVVGKDATATFEGTYTQHVGAVAVYIEGPSEALWKISGIEESHAGGEAAKDLPVGEYTVSFSDADGWEKPEDQPVTVFRNVTAMATGSYTRHVGSVSTVIEGPENALWKLNGEGNYSSGEVVQGLPVG